MDNSNNKNIPNTQAYLSKEDDYDKNSQNGIYLRDDHCDWGSSGMNEFTNKYSEDK